MDLNKLILCRHAETDVNAQGVMHKTQDSAALNHVGVEQSKRLGEVLRNQNVAAVICSSEARALQTAETATAGTQIKISQTPDLQERNWGEWGGKPWGEIQAALEPMSLEERYTFTPPNGESWQDFEARLTKALREIEALPYETIAVIAHGGTLRALMPIIKDEPKETSFKYDFHNASVTIFKEEDEKYSLVVENDISHLSQQG